MPPKKAPAVDWDAVDARLPTGLDQESRAARKALFNKMDSSRNKELSLTEVQSGLPVILSAKAGFRVKGSTAVPLVPVDFKPAIKCAFLTARALDTGSGSRGSTSVSFQEFHALLICFRKYLELNVMFEKIDSSDDGKVSFRECKSCLKKLESWSITQEDLNNKFHERKGDDDGLAFENFAQWCISEHLGKFDVQLDVEGAQPAPAAEEQPAEEKAAETAAEQSQPVAEESAVAPAAETEAPEPEVAQETQQESACPAQKSYASVSDWAADLRLQFETFACDDRVEAVYKPTGEVCPATVREERDGLYIIDWDPVGDYILKADREKCSSELKRLKAKEAVEEESPAPAQPEAETAPPEPEVPDADAELRQAAGVKGEEDDPLALKREQRQIEDHFVQWDADGNGTISQEELLGVLTRLNPRFTSEMVADIFAAADANKDGGIDYMEFLSWCFDKKNL